jgi:hypothetical protein
MTSVLADRLDVIEVVDRLFINTDRKDWPGVRGLFADAVDFDMTSLAGGAPARLSPAEIAAGWEKGLADIEAVHHQSGNYLVELQGDQAKVFCYAVATHWRPTAAKRITTFVGSYDLHLRRTSAGWRIDAFRYNKKYVD